MDNSRKEIIQNFGSFFIIFLNFGSFNKCYLFTGHDFVRQQWFNFFPKLFIITSIFCTQILIIFSFTFSQNCSTQVPLLIIIDFFSSLLFLRKIFLSLVLTIIALDKEWLPITYFFFRGARLPKFYWRKMQNFHKRLEVTIIHHSTLKFSVSCFHYCYYHFMKVW